MSRSQICLSDFGSDIPLTLMLKSWELKSFLFLLAFAAAGQDPWLIPAGKRSRLRLAMKLGNDVEKFEKRLAVFAGDADLIELRADGAIFIKYLEEQDFLDRREAAERREGGEEYDDTPGSGQGYANGNGTNHGSGYRNGNGYAVKQPNRRYSDDPESVARRERRQRSGGEPGGGRRATDFADTAQAGPRASAALAEETGSQADILPGNVRPVESKRPGPPPELAPEMSGETEGQLSGQEADIPRGREDVRDVEGSSKNSLISDNVSDVPHESGHFPNVRPQNVRPSQSSASSRPTVPPLRPPLRPQDVPAARQVDVRQVMRDVGDDPEVWTRQWTALWKHCYEHNLLSCWDEGRAMFAWRLKVSPLSGPGSIRSKSKWQRGTILALLTKAGAPYVPVVPEPVDETPVDPAEAAEAHRQALELKAQWDAEARMEAGATPLEEMPGYEEEE